MRLKLLIIFSTLSLISCKDNLTKEYCYEIKEDYVYMNFYNNTNENIQIAKVTSVVDKDLNLLEEYFKIENDTLFIKMPDASHINISHKSDDTKVIVKNDKINLKKGKSIQQLFKIGDSFKYIFFDDNSLLKRCSSNNTD